MMNRGLMATSYPIRNFSTPTPEATTFNEAASTAKPDESIFASADYFKDVKIDEISDTPEVFTEAAYVD
jgi:hypothetical protein